MKTRKGIGAALLAMAGLLAVPACGVGSKSATTTTTTAVDVDGNPVEAEAIDIDAAIEASKESAERTIEDVRNTAAPNQTATAPSSATATVCPIIDPPTRV